MGTCGFIPVGVSISHTDLVIPIQLLKFLIGKWLHSLCPGSFAFLKWMMVGWKVGSIKFYVSVLNEFGIPIEYFTAPSISLVDNNIWAGCFVPVIRFLVILFSIRVAICFDSSSRLLRQVRRYFSVPVLTVLLTFHSIVVIVQWIYFIIECIQNLFYLTGGRILCCTRAFICWM